MQRVETPKKRRRVVVTGMGAVTPLGNSLNDTWNGIVEGISVAGPVRRFDASQYPSQIAYEVRDFALADGILKPGEERWLTPASAFGVKAAHEAWLAAGLEWHGTKAAHPARQRRTAVCLGVGIVSPDLELFAEEYAPRRLSQDSLERHLRFFPDQLTPIVAGHIGAHGMPATVHTACASSGQALGEAFEMVAYGDADVVLTGGADSMINPFYFAGFSLIGALSQRNGEPRTASCPFDRGRDGFVFGEGAGMLVLEEYESARRRGAEILGEVCGYGVTESAYRITDLHPDGVGPVEAMQEALADAGIRPDQVGYVNAHGTSTQLNDRIEALALAKVFGFGKDSVPVSSTKSMTGHAIAAAGAIEFALCVQALRWQTLPPSINVREMDPECRVRLTGSTAQRAKLAYALSNSVGFGGSNTALIAGSIRT